MGKFLFDKFTYLHFATGVVIYYWGISLFHWLIAHTIFEIIENTSYGIYFIDNICNYLARR